MKVTGEILLKVQQQKLGRESTIVATGKAVPRRQKQQRDKLAQVNISQKFEAPEHVLERKIVCGHIVRVNNHGTRTCHLILRQVEIGVAVKVDTIKGDAA